MKVTKWFPPNVRPVRKGWYHTSVSNKNPTFNKKLESDYNWWWNGSKWTYPLINEYPLPSKVLIAAVQKRYWRGISK